MGVEEESGSLGWREPGADRRSATVVVATAAAAEEAQPPSPHPDPLRRPPRRRWRPLLLEVLLLPVPFLGLVGRGLGVDLATLSMLVSDPAAIHMRKGGGEGRIVWILTYKVALAAEATAAASTSTNAIVLINGLYILVHGSLCRLLMFTYGHLKRLNRRGSVA